MNLYLLIIFAIISVIVILLAINSRCRRDKAVSDNNELNNVDEYILSVTAQCRDIICRALDCLAENDIIEACKNNRTGSEQLYSLSHKIETFFHKNNSADDLIRVYLSYMIESADKISETSRHLVTKPEQKISISDKCEIRAIRKYIDEMLNENRMDSNGSLRHASTNKNFLGYLIAERSKSMRHDDFNDGSQSYSYLILLYYLHSFTNSFYQIISISSRLPRQ